MAFNDELLFEKALIDLLTNNGWEKEILKNKTEEELIENWAKILFENNRQKDRLNNIPLTRSEMQQILDQISSLGTPLRCNNFINGRTVTIKRDNELDKSRVGKEVSLKIYDRQEICAGQSRYQIAEQPIFTTRDIYPDRRGDLMLLINGMPVFHIELKRSDSPISKATNQIKKYAHEGVFTGLFSLVQIFVAMTPEETVYFANPGNSANFNDKFFFHWADFNNEPINDYKQIARTLLHIPTAHQMIGFYTVADNGDGKLKVMRSYQYYAANGIADKVGKIHWDDKEIYGGYIWHTTGSGKTMTSFKSACLIADSKDADKVVFLMDRIELSNQSLIEYRGFADDYTEVQATEDTVVLLNKLKSNDSQNTLIVTSIQKMSNLKEDGAYNQADIELINKKRIVFIVDECHRSTFGDMLADIKKTFNRAIFFGFSGTPILEANSRKGLTEADVFGNEIHRYTIADGIRDGNVLGFDPTKVLTFKDNDLRLQVALDQANAKSIEDALANPDKKKVYEYYMDKSKVKMVGYSDKKGNYIKGIEDHIIKDQYKTEEHRNAVVSNILENWVQLSNNGKYHAILATSSINEAIEYYSLLRGTNIKVTAVFDQSYDNNDDETIIREDAVKQILKDYNKNFQTTFKLSDYKKFKLDVQRRLAHKKPYLYIGNEPEKQLNMVIVVDQMLTGYDSQWINTLYLDKFYSPNSIQNIIQAFSRTNRLSDYDKPQGIIKYYRYSHTMEQIINYAFQEYSGNKMFGVFVDKLYKNLNKMNSNFGEIKEIFESSGIQNFEKLPDGTEEIAEFAKLFNRFNFYLEPAKVQGFAWNVLEYDTKDDDGKKIKIICDCNKETYDILLTRYKEISIDGGVVRDPQAPYDIKAYLTEIDTGTIDAEWMNSRFEKYKKAIESGENVDEMKEQLSKTFAHLSQEDQKFANIFLHDMESGQVKLDENKTIVDYISEYKLKAKNDQIFKFASVIGVNESKLRKIMDLGLNAKNINEFGRFENLLATVNKSVAKQYFETRDNKTYSPFAITQKVNEILREFILKDGFDL